VTPLAGVRPYRKIQTGLTTRRSYAFNKGSIVRSHNPEGTGIFPDKKKLLLVRGPKLQKILSDI
jgi:hypothetical protein